MLNIKRGTPLQVAVHEALGLDFWKAEKFWTIRPPYYKDHWYMFACGKSITIGESCTLSVIAKLENKSYAMILLYSTESMKKSEVFIIKHKPFGLISGLGEHYPVILDCFDVDR